LSRGDMLVAAENPPHVSKSFHAMVVWLHEEALELGKTYLVKHNARQTKARAVRFHHRVNVNTLAKEHASRLQMNEIAAVELEANVPLFFDAYSRNRTTGSFILIDPLSNATVGAGMIQEEEHANTAAQLEKVEWRPQAQPQAPVTAEERYARHGHYPAIVLLENRPELGSWLERVLFDQGFELLHWTNAEQSGGAFEHALGLAQAAGIVVIYSGEPLAAETKRGLAARFGTRVFEPAANVAGDDEAGRQALAFARTLLLVGAKRETNREQVN
jgi:hypothetical protein